MRLSFKYPCAGLHCSANFFLYIETMWGNHNKCIKIARLDLEQRCICNVGHCVSITLECTSGFTTGTSQEKRFPVIQDLTHLHLVLSMSALNSTFETLLHFAEIFCSSMPRKEGFNCLGNTGVFTLGEYPISSVKFWK